VVNARQVRGFAVATEVLAKTDAVDARILAHFAAAVRPTVRALPDEQRQSLNEIMSRWRQLVGRCVMEKNRLAQARNSGVRRDIKSLIAVLQKRIKGCNPSRRRSTKRVRHLPTVFLLIHNRRATPSLGIFCAHAKMVRERKANA
jgi:transposase